MTHIFFNVEAIANLDMLTAMTLRPCPVCRTPTTWEGNAYRPFCSARCQTRDLGAWSSESYRVPERPQEEDGEGWTGEGEEG